AADDPGGRRGVLDDLCRGGNRSALAELRCEWRGSTGIERLQQGQIPGQPATQVSPESTRAGTPYGCAGSLVPDGKWRRMLQPRFRGTGGEIAEPVFHQPGNHTGRRRDA